MKSRPLKIAIIGCRSYAYQLILRIQTLPNLFNLVAVLAHDDTDCREAAECAARGAKIYSELEPMLRAGTGVFDAILNPTPIHIHCETTLKCIRAGFRVWLEKPPVATLDEHEQIIATSRQVDVKVDVCFNSIYSFRIQELKSELTRGVYGDVLQVRGVAGWQRTESYFTRNKWAGQLRVGEQWVYDGSINNPLAHVVCNCLYFAASQHHALASAKEVEARLWHANPIDSEDISALKITTQEGIEVITNLCLCPESSIPALTVIDTEKATITIENLENIRIEYPEGDVVVRESYKESRIDMLESLYECTCNNDISLCSIEMTKPFTEVVNLAFNKVLARHNGRIPAVASNLVKQKRLQESRYNYVDGIDHLLTEAHSSGKLVDIPISDSDNIVHEA